MHPQTIKELRKVRTYANDNRDTIKLLKEKTEKNITQCNNKIKILIVVATLLILKTFLIKKNLLKK